MFLHQKNRGGFQKNIMTIEPGLLSGDGSPQVGGEEVMHAPVCSECVCMLECQEHRGCFSVLSHDMV